MLIAIDKNSISAYKQDENKYIYLFEEEPLEDLLKLNMHCIHYSRCDYVDINLTDYDIDCLKQAKITEKDYDVLPEKVNYKIGIIVPNFNYEHTIKKCLTSIFNQTYTNYEIIFIDDCSTDNSVEIVKELYSDLLLSDKDFGTLKIVQLKQKRYNGGARNEAYLHLSDDVDYVWYVDSDDWLLDETVLEKINNKLQKRPDVLFVGLSKYKNDETSVCYIPKYRDKYEAMKGWSGSCGKVIKKSLATRQECLYCEGTLKEDRNQHCRICIYMNTFDILKNPVYVWNQSNTKSITTIREKTKWGTSTIRHYADTLELYLSEKGKDVIIDGILEKRVQMTKNEVEIGGDKQW